MGLETYRKKRDFGKTPEPAGAVHAKTGWSYLIQRHAASRLHYDFRLELDGVLKSWAVPKGPSLDPADKRLAMHVEDHPVEYGTFEGVIPKGEYGGGTVMLWDRGHWIPEGDARAGYAAGKLKFRLAGERLHGGWTLVRIRGPRNEDGKSWLLIKERDEAARPGAKQAIVDELTTSVTTDRTMDEIAQAQDRVWHSKEPSQQEDGKKAVKPASVRATKAAATKARGSKPATRDSAGSRRGGAAPARASTRKTRKVTAPGAEGAPLPAAIEPELATLAGAAPTGDDWLHEIKLDGYRIVARLEGGAVWLTSRNGHDWTPRLPSLAGELAGLAVRQAVLDGEIVMFEPDGTTSFQLLQNAIGGDAEPEIVYCVFDLLHLDGLDLTGSPLRARKVALAELLAESASTRLRYLDHVEGRGPQFFEKACAMRLEGIISKRADSPYRPGRSRDWLKTKCLARQEFVIVGYTEPARARTGFGALLLGVHGEGGDGKLVYAGRVGTGFTEKSLRGLQQKLVPLERMQAPVADPPRGAAARGIHWVEPKLVAEVAFTGWTDDGVLRHPSFQGLREDKSPAEIVRERPAGEVATRTHTAPALAAQKAKTFSVARKGEVVIGGVRLTNPGRVLYEGITKRMLAEFYEQIADRVLAHVGGRPLMLRRCPTGLDKDCFYQKHAKATDAAAVRRITIDEDGDSATWMMVDDVAGLISLVQMGTLETHVWGSRHETLEHPDRMIFDLDPDVGLDWLRVVEGARLVRDQLAAIGLTSFVKTTGGKGLHVVVPIEPVNTWDEVKQFTKDVAEAIAARQPSKYTAVLSKSARKGRIFIDYLRNGRGATAVAAWSTRARAGAPVSTPVRWNELGKDLRSDRFNVQNLGRRLAALKDDPWEGFFATKQRLPRKQKR